MKIKNYWYIKIFLKIDKPYKINNTNISSKNSDNLRLLMLLLLQGNKQTMWFK